MHFPDVMIDRGQLLTKEALDDLTGEYKRYAVTESGISPRAVPGHPNAVFMACSDEHDEYGHFADEDAENRIRMNQKRLRKLETALQDIRPPLLYGPEHAEVTLAGWGSSFGPIREAVDRLNKGVGTANSLHFVDLWPFPTEGALPFLKSAVRLVAVENNGTGQFGRLLRAHTGIQVDDQILRFDGRPVSPEYILERLQWRGEDDA